METITLSNNIFAIYFERKDEPDEYLLGINLGAFKPYMHRQLKQQAKPLEIAKPEDIRKLASDLVKLDEKAVKELDPDFILAFSWFDFVPFNYIVELEDAFEPEVQIPAQEEPDVLSTKSGPVAVWMQTPDDGSESYILTIREPAFKPYLLRQLNGKAKRISGCPEKFKSTFLPIVGELLLYFSWYNIVPGECIRELNDALLKDYEEKEKSITEFDILLNTDGSKPVASQIPERNTVVTPPRIPAEVIGSQLLKVREKIQHAMHKRFFPGDLIKSSEITHAVMEDYPDTNPGSIIPKDYCCNTWNMDPSSGIYHIFFYSEAQKSYQLLPFLDLGKPRHRGDCPREVEQDSNSLPSIKLESSPTRVEDIKLSRFSINKTAVGYSSLKNGNRNVAIWRQLPDGFILGIKSGFLNNSVKQVLSQQPSFLNQCPSRYIPLFSPHGGFDWPHTSYEWFLVEDTILLANAIQALDGG